MEAFEFLGQLSEAVGVSGHEAHVGRLVIEAFTDLGAEVREDRLGSIIARFPGAGPEPRCSIMFAAHMDEVGLMVTRIEKGGFLRFAGIGVDPRTLLAQELVVHGREDLVGVVGTQPPHLTPVSERDQAIPRDEQFIDLGLPEEEVRRLVRVGDVVTPRRRVTRLLGRRAAGKAFDDRAGVATLYEAARRLQGMRHAADVYMVATVQEEVGLRGAMTSTYALVPDIGIAVDVGFAEYPGQGAEATSLKFGGGSSIGLGANIHRAVYSLLTNVAEEHGIAFQVEPFPAGTGTDAWAMQVTRAGVPTGVLSIPLRYMHTSVEIVDINDVVETGRLIAHTAARVTSDTVEGLRHA